MRANPAQLIPLWNSYESMMGMDAWADFYSRLDMMREQIQNHIMAGSLDEGGRDVTDALRANYGLICNIMAIPGFLEEHKISAEQMLGLHSEET